MLAARDVSVNRGPQVVLDAVSLSLDGQSRLGIVGPNGVGKSTLLRVLAGEVQPDAGRVERTPGSLRVAHLAQETDAWPGEGLIAYLGRRTGVAEAEAELDRQTARLASDTGAIDDYSAALEAFVDLGGDDFEARAAKVAAEVGIPADRLAVPVIEYSGGQAARARLAAVLLTRADVLLLDEPTNDLDFAGLDLLEEAVTSFQGAVATVSHDRAFLDRIATRILEVEEHSHRSSEYAGGWSDYVERRALARSQAGAAFEAWKAERNRLRDRIRSQRAWSDKGARKAARRPKDNDRAQRGFVVNRTEKQAAKVRIDSAWVSRRLFRLVVSGHQGLRVGSVVAGFGLGGGDVAELTVDAFGVEP